MSEYSGSVNSEFVLNVIKNLRAKLLELSGRNALISFRHSERARKQLRVIDTTIDKLYQLLEDNRPITFVPLPTSNSEPEDEQTPEFLAALETARDQDESYKTEVDKLGPDPSVKALLKLENELRDRLRSNLGMSPIDRGLQKSKYDHAVELGIDPSYELSPTRAIPKKQKRIIQTFLYSEELERKLSAILSHSRLSESETGINTLFCSFGFLEWYESNDSAKPIYSPILLYPLQIVREVKNGEYIYQTNSRDEDLLENICLRERLKRDFGIELFGLKEDETPESYICRIEELMENKPTWKVHKQVTVGFFTFSKLIMYHDLDPDNLSDLNDESPLSKIIAGSDGHSEPGFASDYEIDRPEIQKKIKTLITDADSSQLSALIDIQDGKDTVIEGPPGTGKSQTITNIIASAINRGKTVLFVAEKRAALEVVKKRLDNAGLGLFCLELHSNKTRKTDVLNSLKERLTARRAGTDGFELERLIENQEKTKNTIMEYLKVLNVPAGKLRISLHELLWRYLRIRQELPHLPFDLRNVILNGSCDLSDSDFEINKSLLNALESNFRANLTGYTTPELHPWHGLASGSHRSDDLVQLRKAVHDTLDEANQFEETLGNNPSVLAHVKDMSYKDIESTNSAIFDLTPLLESDIECNLLSDLSNDAKYSCLRSGIKRHDTIQEFANKLSNYFADVTLVNCSDQRVREFAEKAARGSVEKDTVKDIESRIVETEAESAFWHELVAFLQTAKRRFGIEVKLSIINSMSVINAISVLQKIDNQDLKYRSRRTVDTSNFYSYKAAEERFLELRAKQRAFSDVFHLERGVQTGEIDKNSQILKDATVLSFLRSDFRAAKQFFYCIYKASDKVKPKKMAELLVDLSSFLKFSQEFADDLALKQICEPWFTGLNTPLEALFRVNKWSHDVVLALRAIDDFALQLRSLIFELPESKIMEIKEMGDHPLFAKIKKVINELNEGGNNLSSKDIVEYSESLDSRLSQLHELLRFGLELNAKPQTIFDNYFEIADLLRDYTKLKAEHSRDNELKAILGTYFDAIGQNRDKLLKTLNYVETINNSQLPESIKRDLISPDATNCFHTLTDGFQLVVRGLQRLADWFGSLESIHATKDGYSQPLRPFSEWDRSQLLCKLKTALAKIDELPNLVDYLVAEQEIRQQNLYPVLQVFSNSGCEFRDLSKAYELCVYSNVLKEACKEHPQFSKSVSFYFDELRDRFKETDTKIIDCYRELLVGELSHRSIEKGVSVGKVGDLSELGLIRHEMTKERKHIPLRELLSRAGRAVAQMKPCFMMSPLSVAQYLYPNYKFDLVVMDEASQLRPEEALGAILRAKQVVVVGDPKQLPPTDFFNFSDDSSLSNEDVADYEYDQESILDLGLKSLEATRRLRWHYRSKHQSLIAYSNFAFYDNDLIVFPSSYDSRDEFGISLVPVEGIYDKRKNIIEAEAVAREAINFMKMNIKKSLGIVAINQEQRDLITELIDKEEKRDPLIQSYKAEWEKSLEPFFVKNLENVQGDERDVIFVSTVYGKDTLGNFYQRFGPINSSTGHRRLNVLFTRAKCQTKILSSIDPEGISIDSHSSLGVRAFKGFLEYAKHGKLADYGPNPKPARPADSDFEVVVMKNLSEKGYIVEPQIGVAGFFIDIGVKHPNYPNKYILGIECDGATYHSAKCARDRDKTRQQILENLGWKIHRIWSTDWYNNHERELKRLISKLPPIAHNSN